MLQRSVEVGACRIKLDSNRAVSRAGQIFHPSRAAFDAVEHTVIVLEAMKMETTVKTPIGGKIIKVYVQNGDKVKSGDPLFEVST